MEFRSVRMFAAVAAVFAALVPLDSQAIRPEQVAGGGGPIKPTRLPLGLSKQPVTVVVQLAADPVAVQQGNAGRKLDRAEREQIKAQLRGAQSSLHGNIQSLGGTVVANYQSAYNGIKVRIARDKVNQLAALPGVVAVRPVYLIKPTNVHGVPLIGTPAVWQNLGIHGEGIKIGIIDTGIDYTHANFGGPGTVAVYEAAHAAETAPADPTLFGPMAPRVKGGTDLVGDSYDPDPNSPTYQPTPHPDPNPLDCPATSESVGHGSHVAGTAAGSGVLSTGATYTGPYNATTISGNSWTVGPGVAPKADLYAIRVFGCQGPTDVVVDAIEWAVDNDMDVINMSLGSPFGSKDSPDAVAATNAAKAGVVVVTSAGNEGPNQYVVGTPGTADGAIAVAAIDPTSTFPGVPFTLNTGGAQILAQNSNNAATVGGTYSVVVLRNANGTVSLGCDPAEYTAAGVTGKLVVTQRGTCARVARAIFGQKAGAAAVAMIDTSTGYPPFEGQITSNPDTGEAFTVTIPFFGVRGLASTATSDGGRLAASTSVAIGPALQIPNPNFLGFASFSSSGPRTGDSGLKPDISAPGVSIVSTASGTGNGAETLSGTSMASPHVTGVAALTRQAHPNWNVAALKAAIVNTGDPAQVAAYRTSRGGTGLVQPAKSTVTQVIAQSEDGQFLSALNFGFNEINRDFKDSRTVVLRNLGSKPATFSVSSILSAGSPHTIDLNHSSITVPAHGSKEVRATLSVPVATAGASNEGGLSFHEVAGVIQFAPADAATNGGAALRVPYYLVPRALSDVSTSIGRLSDRNSSTTAKITNRRGAIPGDADFYAWGLEDKKDPGRVSNDVRAVGTQSFPFPTSADPNAQLLVFAVNTFDRWSNAASNEFDIFVDVDGDGVDDYLVVGTDVGNLTAGDFNGQLGVAVFSLRSGAGFLDFVAVAPTDSSTALLPVLSSRLCQPNEPCLSATNPRITYHVVSFDQTTGGSDEVKGTAKFNVWTNAISTGGFATVNPGATDTSVQITVNSDEFQQTPAKGLMIVTFDNKSGEDEAQLIPVRIGR